MLRRLFAAALALAAVPMLAGHAAAQPPAPLDPTLFSFPGIATVPATARSASVALADRWLGGDVYDNPAAGPVGDRIEIAPVMLRVSRQDLRGHNRDYSEESAYFDLAGGALRLGNRAFLASVYATQPLLRLEDNTFTIGLSSATSSGVMTTSTAAREAVGGIALSYGSETARVGVAGEWRHRDDRYETKLESGAPTAGTTSLSFSGDGFGASLGARAKFVPFANHPLTVGVAYRFVPSLDLKGDQTSDLTVGSSTASIAVTRSSSWESGGSASWEVTPAFHALVSVGGHGAQRYEAWGVSRGSGSEWSLAGDYHDARDPFALRFGFGAEQQSGTPEPRAGRVGLGFSWLMDSTTLDLGVEHLTLQRPGEPNSTDDRVLLSLIQKF